MYSNYHCHSYYSNIITPDSTVSPEDYAKRAKELGHMLLSSVNHGYQGRYIEYYELAKQYDLKYLFGLEAYIVKNRFEKDRTNSHIILLAKNESGRKAINRIMSEASLSGYYYRPRIDFDLLFSLPKDDVWITTACVAGIWKYEDADDIVLKFKDYFGSNFFLEVQYHNTESQKKLNAHIVDLSNHHNIPIIFGSDSHFIYPEQKFDRDDFLLSKHIEYEDENDWLMDYCSDEEAYERFVRQGVLTKAQINEAINNTNIFLEVEEYDSEIFNKEVKLPSVYPDKTQEEKNKIFSDLIWRQWEIEKENIPKNRWNTYETEIKKEEKVIIETNMADYFLLDYEVVKRGKELGGHITMTGRGSASSFIISKLLGFTTVDRISASVKLFPERFITKERILEAGTLPDIDFNLGNPEIFAQAQEEFLGKNHSYPMCAYGTLQPKAAWKLYARAKNIPFDDANKVSQQIEQYEMDLKHLEEDEKDSINVVDYVSEEYRELYEQSTKYLGIIVDSRAHACAYLLFDKDIREEIGLVRLKNNICTIMDGLWAENYKFLKNDLLKVSVVELIYRVYERIGREPDPLPELIKACSKDNKVWDIYKNAWVMGINQVEQTSTGGRVAKYAPQNISELSAFIAAVRPGFKSNYKQFEARENFCYGIESLDNLLQTKEFPQSYMLYQEQAMLAMSYAGIPISQTYEIIKNIAKKRVEKVLKYKEQFIEGMTKKVIRAEKKSQEEAENIAQMTWKIIEDSSHYQFNAAHSYCYAGDSLYGAYLKANYPFEFYEVFLNMLEQNGDKNRLIRVKEEAQSAFGIKFSPLRFGQDNRRVVAKPETNEIISSLSSIKGFPQSFGEKMYLLSQRQYKNFLEFLVTVEEEGYMTKKIEDLIKINYFDCFGNNQKLLDFYNIFIKGENKYSKKHSCKTKQKRLDILSKIWYDLPDKRIPFLQQLKFEEEILGIIQATFPVDRRYVYVINVNEKFAPRSELYCLATGKRLSIKTRKAIYENNPFFGGEILFCEAFEKKPSVIYKDGRYENLENEFTWWLNQYKIIEPNKFDSTINNN